MFTPFEKVRYIAGMIACLIDVRLALALMLSAIIPSVYRDWRDEQTAWHVWKRARRAKMYTVMHYPECLDVRREGWPCICAEVGHRYDKP